MLRIIISILLQSKDTLIVDKLFLKKALERTTYLQSLDPIMKSSKKKSILLLALEHFARLIMHMNNYHPLPLPQEHAPMFNTQLFNHLVISH